MAITSLVLGCVGLFACGLFGVGSVMGLTFGIIAIVKARRYPMAYGGQGLAIAGVTLNGGFLLALPLLMAIAIPNLMQSRRAANEASAIATLRVIARAEMTYQDRHKGEFGDLKQLEDAALLSETVELRNGYRFEVTTPIIGSRQIFEAYASPAKYGLTGDRSFYISTDQIIHSADRSGYPATKSDPPLDPSYESAGYRGGPE